MIKQGLCLEIKNKMILNDEEKSCMERLVYTVEYKVFEKKVLEFLDSISNVDTFNYDKGMDYVAAQAIGTKIIKDEFIYFLRSIKALSETVDKKVDVTYE